MLWNGNKVNLQVVASSKHTITVLVAVGNIFWVTTFVYANPNGMLRRKLWVYLNSIRKCFKGPWVVMGDFNEIISGEEKRGGRQLFFLATSLDMIKVITQFNFHGH